MKFRVTAALVAVFGSHALPCLAQPSVRFADAPSASPALPVGSRVHEHERPLVDEACGGAGLLVGRARRLSARGNVLSALSAYSQAVTLYPKCGVATLELASLRANLGDYTEAERLFDRAVHLREHAPEAFKARAVMRRRQGQRAAALSDLGAAVAMRPDDIESVRLLADWFIEERVWPAALAQCRALVRLLTETKQNAELAQAELRVRALAIMAAETDPVAEGARSENWVRRSLSKLAQP